VTILTQSVPPGSQVWGLRCLQRTETKFQIYHWCISYWTSSTVTNLLQV